MKMTDEILEIQSKVEKAVDGKRFRHILGVAHTAACMAMCYGLDVDRAYLAGVLHDCAKGYKKEEYLSICRDKGIPITPSEEKSPSLLHAKLGAYFAETLYNTDDWEILSAIRCHTTGKPNMSLLDKIIYIADYIEPNRHIRTDMDTIRKIAFTDIDKCLLIILENTVSYLEQSGKSIDMTTKETYEYYRDTVK
ncbi:MAG: bis(5'-nucleosyl)-tetraphosphatase (symmetrical) YqeK [Lachnospiraceae bacterium]|nr:bis(5'-nucleosyl)-tetraphosphatase (symmetrical) YqeK [Lachnospiraceae bacterium]